MTQRWARHRRYRARALLSLKNRCCPIGQRRPRGSVLYICYREEGRASSVVGLFNNAIKSRRGATYLYLLDPVIEVHLLSPSCCPMKINTVSDVLGSPALFGDYLFNTL
jgi:hypothetical protein